MPVKCTKRQNYVDLNMRIWLKTQSRILFVCLVLNNITWCYNISELLVEVRGIAMVQWGSSERNDSNQYYRGMDNYFNKTFDLLENEDGEITFLAPPSERQWSLSNAELSVVCHEFFI